MDQINDGIYHITILYISQILANHHATVIVNVPTLSTQDRRSEPQFALIKDYTIYILVLE